MKGPIALVTIAVGLAAAPAWAAGPTAKELAIARTLVYRTGTIAVRDARIDLPPGYRYLNARDAQRVLTGLYRNPPAPEVRALILPPRATAVNNVYFIVVTYRDDGHVSDRDAARINYSKLLHAMEKDDVKENATRAKIGYDPVHTVGWAEQPRYDASTHKLYWATELSFGTQPEDTLNYDVRTLGREGLLSLDAVALMSDIGAVRTGMQTVLRSSHFVGGRRYEDFRGGDRTSSLTIAALVGGGAYAAAKTGLIALVLAKLKFLVVGLVGLAGAFRRKLFRRGSRS